MEIEEKVRLHELMVRLADGDRSAFEPIYLALWPLVRRFTHRALGGSTEAEDAAQIVLLKLFSQASHYDPDGDLVSWVLTIAAYECRTFRQRFRRRRESPADLAPHAVTEMTPEDAIIYRDLEQATLELMGGLRPIDRETLQAVMSGKRPQIPGSTFRKRLERALERLRAAVSSRHGID